MMEAVLALRYDPRLFTVSPADVQLGTLPLAGSGWQLTTIINAQMGEIGIDLFSLTPIQSQASGSLVTIAMDIVGSEFGAGGEGAVGNNGGSVLSQTPLSLVNQVDPTGERVFTTEAADAQSAFVLHWAAGVMSNTPLPPPAAGGPPPSSASVAEQVFAKLGQWFWRQTAASLLAAECFQMPITDVVEPAAFQQEGVAEPDWPPVELVADLGQTANAGEGSQEVSIEHADAPGTASFRLTDVL